MKPLSVGNVILLFLKKTFKNRFYKNPEPEKGQVAVLIGIMTLTIIFFLQFVISTGLLVNAKINLQNAADMAAYSGAATQARLLNDISFLNYEMRRQYKKFLMRYYVIGGRFQKTYTTSTGALRRWSPDEHPPSGTVIDFRQPAVCVTFNTNDNYCQITVAERIENIPVSPLDPISQILHNQLNDIENLRRSQCDQIKFLNQYLTLWWLYRPDPDDQTIRQALRDVYGSGPVTGGFDADKTFDTVKNMVSGIGLVPREIILYQRINTLMAILNFPAQKNVSRDSLDQLMSENNALARERTKNAYESAFYTLGEHTFRPSSFSMDELLPEGPLGTETVFLNPIKVNFEVYWLWLQQNAAGSCVGVPTPWSIRELPVGFYKEKTKKTFYAIRLKAKVRLMMLPGDIGEIELKAYSVAKPFGSRIGPDPSEMGMTPQSMWVNEGAFSSNTGTAPTAQCGGTCYGIPNLPLDGGDSLQAGWNHNSWIHSIGTLMEETSGGGATGSLLTLASMARGFRAAMVPNPWEKGKYNIPNDLYRESGDDSTDGLGDPMVRFFDDNFIHPMYAPVQVDDPRVTSVPLEQTFDQYIQDIGDALDGQQKNSLLQVLRQYVTVLQRGQGEGRELVPGTQEGLNLFRLIDPLHHPPTGPGAPPVPITGLPDIYHMKSIDDIKTSYVTQKDSDITKHRRTGYSVKFIPFTSLGEGGNLNFLDSMAEEDLGGQQMNLIKH